MQRILISDTPNFTNKKVKVSGFVDVRRDHGKIIFIDLKDISGVLQIVFTPQQEETYKLAQTLGSEWVVSIEGNISERPEKLINQKLLTGKVELQAEKLEVLSKAETLPFDLKDLNVSLPTLLDFRPLTLRNEKIKAIFKIQEQVIISFRNALKDLGFTEFQSPTIVPASAEGGSEVFHIDYYDYDAYLAQSPQFYKQILVGVFEKVFTVTRVFRAEPSVTTRHLSEFTGLDAEFGFIDSWEDIMDTCEKVVKRIFSDLELNCKKELELYNVKLPEIGEKIPHIKMREVQQIIFERTKRDNRKEMDLQPDDEKEICVWAKEKHNSDFVFVTHYPTKKRPFYTLADPENPEYTLSFDLLCSGVELVSGGQRVNNYEALKKNIEKWGNKIEGFDFYLQSFKYGMPPEGGFGMGAERIVKQILNLENLREATLFPRDMERIDQRLSVLQPDKKKKEEKKK